MAAQLYRPGAWLGAAPRSGEPAGADAGGGAALRHATVFGRSQETEITLSEGRSGCFNDGAGRVASLPPSLPPRPLANELIESRSMDAPECQYSGRIKWNPGRSSLLL